MGTYMQQRVLDLSIREEATFENFLVGKNAQTLTALQSIVYGKERYAYLYGPSDVGRTHLLQAACHTAREQRKTTVYLPLAEHKELSPHMLEGLERLQIVCIDDVDHVAGQLLWEEALMHLYNRLKTEQGGLIIAGSELPKHSGFQLNDLISRLSWGLVFFLHPLTDEEKLTALKRSAHNRGMFLSDQVGHFLLRRGSRNLGVLFEELLRLEKASLVARKPLTLPFVKTVLEIR